MTPSGWTDPQPGLQFLRAAFPHWAFLYDPFAFRWVAVLGKHLTLSAGTPEELAERLGHHRRSDDASGIDHGHH